MAVSWSDQGYILAASRHGENGLIVDCYTESHGRARGYVRSGASKRQRSLWQPGNHVSLEWRSRLAENLGQFKGELLHSPLGDIITHGSRLTVLSAVTAVMAASTAEGDAHRDLYDMLGALVTIIEASDAVKDWGLAYLKLELALLEAAGYGLDLSKCAATGSRDQLIYVSPKSGRAVSAAAGEPYRHKLLPLPAFLVGGTPQDGDILAGLTLTGYFLNRQLWIARRGGEPDARLRFHDWLKRHIAKLD